ncbi:hypothetical protein MSG28_005821 [Choristoneura fumiferana]|uniref:Uncharacterized protein n=1 Tax=Choristoneura fumiferana TaxID=7141 RepID=A0ACC0L178_CHOFU|nr:hypothetical protein MSG28_005821 [Choristoneura fumiferana]
MLGLQKEHVQPDSPAHRNLPTRLLKFTNYTIKVAGFSNYGAGPFSYPIVCGTLQDVPGPPADIKVLVLSGSSLLVSWKKPDHPNGELLYYTVYVKPTSRLVVVAGVASLGGTVSVAVAVAAAGVRMRGAPAPRTVWYHNHNIITHHPRFTRNHDDSLLINMFHSRHRPIPKRQLHLPRKNLYRFRLCEYSVTVLPLPEAPLLRATPHKHSILVEWEQPYYSANRSGGQD